MLRVIGSEFYDYGDLDGVVIHGKKVEVGTAFWNMYGRGEDPFSGPRGDEIRSWYNGQVDASNWNLDNPFAKGIYNGALFWAEGAVGARVLGFGFQAGKSWYLSWRAGRLAAKTVGNSSKVLLNTSRQLQAKFKHAGDFGVVGNYSKANAAKFSSALNQHINASGTQIIQGAYRNASNPVTFYLNPQTGLNVIASPSGQFISGARLSPAQVQHILTKGFLW